MKNTETGRTVSYYEILQVPQNASDTDIRSAYYRLAKQFHPDRNPQERKLAELRFRLINEAYSHLKSTDQRLRYNQLLKQNKATCRALKKSAGNDNTNPSKGAKRWFFNTFASFFSAPEKRA